MESIIHLLGNSALVKRDEPAKETLSGLILGESDVTKLDTGVVTHISEYLKIGDLSDTSGMIGARVRFREPFAEELEIEGETYLYFRDLEPSIYYVIEK